MKLYTQLCEKHKVKSDISRLNRTYSDKQVKPREPGTYSTSQCHINAVRRHDHSCSWQLTPPFIECAATLQRSVEQCWAQLFMLSPWNRPHATIHPRHFWHLEDAKSVLAQPPCTSALLMIFRLFAHLKTDKKESSRSPPPASASLVIHPTTWTKSTRTLAI